MGEEMSLVHLRINTWYHWRELPQVSFLSRQKSCRDKHVFVETEHVFCRDKSMLVLSRQTRVYLSRHTFVATKDFFVCFFCHDKQVFVATKKIILVAAPANDILEPSFRGVKTMIHFRSRGHGTA